MHLLWFTSVSFSLLIIRCTCQQFTVTPVTTSSGLYYEKIGEVLLSNNNWQFVTSVDYQGYLLFYEYLITQANKIQDFCREVALKECNSRLDAIRSNLDRIEQTDEAMANFLGITTKSRRVKRFFGSIGRALLGIGRTIVGSIFGGGSSRVDLSAYDRQLGDLRAGQRELANQLNLQRTAFLLDSERKSFQIDWLNRTQVQIQNDLLQLASAVAVDSEQKEMKIKELRSMLNETQWKLKMQEAIQKKLVSQVDQIEKKLVQVDKDIKNIFEKIAANTARIDLLELKVTLNTISLDLTFLMDRFEKEQTTLFDVIKNANRGVLDPYILTPLSLVQMLQNIQPNLPEEMKFPFYPNIENANKLYNVIKPSVYLYNSSIIFILEIPLVDAKQFNIHKITSLPIPVGQKKFAFILPQEPFLIIDNNYRDYMLMSVNDFNDFCREMGKDKFLCKQIQQISQAHLNHDCEVVLFRQSKEIPDICNKRLLNLDQPLFFQLQQPMSWIYAIPESEHLTFNCGIDRNTVPLEGVGFIQLNGECVIRTSNGGLTFLLEFSKHVESNYSSPLNLTRFIDTSALEQNQAKSLTRKQVILPFDFKELDKISFALKRAERSLAALYYSLLVLAIIIICVLAYLIYKRKINVDKILILLRIKKENEPLTPPPSQDVPQPHDEKLQIRVKLNKKNENIKHISVHEDPSTTDPDAEYLTVRFKVKKDENKGREPKLNNKNIKTYDNDLWSLPESDKETDSDDDYLKELRKIKPNKFQNEYVYH